MNYVSRPRRGLFVRFLLAKRLNYEGPTFAAGLDGLI